MRWRRLTVMASPLLAAVLGCTGSAPTAGAVGDASVHDVAPDSGGTNGGLRWQEPPSAENMSRTKARAYCADLVATGADDWRLPTISELRALVAGCPATEPGGACTLVDEGGRASRPPYQSCDGCPVGGGPGAGGCYWRDRGGACGTYWSTTNVYSFPPEGHALDFATASMMTLGQFDETPFYVRCVRGP
jgi:Protein of unknown function (DUF1566)